MTVIRSIIDPGALPVTGQRWDIVQFGLLAGLLFFMPAAFGAVEGWSEFIVMLLAAILSVILALRVIFDRSFSIAWTWLFVPLALFVALVALQLVPLSTSLISLLSPNTVRLKQELLKSAADAFQSTTLSFYPRATAHFLRLALVACTVFVTVASVCRRPRQIKLLLTIIFAIGCAQAVVAIAQLATGSSKIYWLIPAERGLVTSGTFINYSHFCQFMNLSLGAGIGLLLVQLFEQSRHQSSSIRRSLLARLSWEKHGWLICGIVLCAMTIFTSMSRNGVISLVVAAAVIGAALGRRGSLRWRGWLLGLLPLGVLCGLLVFGFDEAYRRLATLQESNAYEGRWELTAATLRAWRQFPFLGTGLGTHEVVFPMYDTAVIRSIAQNADNDYAQILEETGLIGASLLIATWVGVATIAARLMFHSKSSIAAAAYGIAFGLLAVTIHSATDFGQRIPANFCLTAAMCGLLVAISRLESRSSQSSAANQFTYYFSGNLITRRAAAVGALVAIVSVWGWGLTKAYSRFLGERWWAAALTMDAKIRKSQLPVSDEDCVDLIASAENALQYDPTNAAYGHWLGYYRWLAISRTTDPGTGQVVLHPDVLPFVEQIADELARVRSFCPTYGPPYALEGQLRTNVLQDPLGAELIRQGVRLAPYDPPSCLVAGQLAAATGPIEEAQKLLQRAVTLDPSYFREVAQIYLEDLKRPDLARSLAEDDYRRIRDLVTICGLNPDFKDLAKQWNLDAEASLRRRVTEENVASEDLASLARIDLEQQKFDSAANLYRRALTKNYKQIEWRLELARALAACGQTEEALHEVQICLRLRPEFAAAKGLKEQLSSPKKSSEMKVTQ